MLAHGGALERLGALRGDVRRAQRLDGGGRVAQIEHDEIERRGESRIVEAREVRHLEVEVLVIDGDVAEESEKHRHRQLPPSLGAGRIARRVGRQRGCQRRQPGSLGAMAYRAVRLEARGTLGKPWGRRIGRRNGE